jgi:hypothetical protein
MFSIFTCGAVQNWQRTALTTAVFLLVFFACIGYCGIRNNVKEFIHPCRQQGTLSRFWRPLSVRYSLSTRVSVAPKCVCARLPLNQRVCGPPIYGMGCGGLGQTPQPRPPARHRDCRVLVPPPSPHGIGVDQVHFTDAGLLVQGRLTCHLPHAR